MATGVTTIAAILPAVISIHAPMKDATRQRGETAPLLKTGSTGPFASFYRKCRKENRRTGITVITL